MHIAKEIHRIILSRIGKDRLDLPAMPTVTAALQTMVKNGQFNVAEIVRLMERDPLTAATMLKTVTAGAGGGSFDTIEQVVNAMGQRGLRPFAADVHSRPIQTSRDPRIDAVHRTLLNHTIAVARLARDIAGILGHQDAEAAYLVGLMHDIGKLIFAGYLLDAERSMAVGSVTWLDATAWEEAISAHHREIGVQVAERWGFPRTIVTFIKDPLEYDAMNRNSPINVACFANALVKSRGLYERAIDEVDNRAVLMLGRTLLGVDDEIVGRLATNIVTPLLGNGGDARRAG